MVTLVNMSSRAADDVAALLSDVPEGSPYRKWTGAHWRLVELADLAELGADVPRAQVEPLIEAELAWLLGEWHTSRIVEVAGRMRRCGSQEGNALYAASVLGFVDDPRVVRLRDRLIAWQWADGGWNCDRRPHIERSSFNESVTPGLGLAAFARATGDDEARAAAQRVAELLLESRMLLSRRTGKVVNATWAVPHYPPYWHYDVLQGVRLLDAVGRLDDPRAAPAIDALEASRRRVKHGGPDGYGGPSWATSRQPGALQRGRGAVNWMLTTRVDALLAAHQGAAQSA